MSQEAFRWLGEGGRLDSSLLERSIYQKNFNDLTGHQNKTEREKKKKKKSQYFCSSSHWTPVSLKLLLPNRLLLRKLKQRYP